MLGLSKRENASKLLEGGKGEAMSEASGSRPDIESALQDYYDFKQFFDDAVEEMGEEELDMLSAASGYAAFLDRMGLSDDSTDL